MRFSMAVSLFLFAATTAPAWAMSVTFSGTTTNGGLPSMPGGPCGPAPELSVSIGPAGATGTSNFGDFSFTASHCLPGPPPGPYNQGIFDFTFTDGSHIGDQLTGTYTGLLTATATMGVFANTQDYVITGGTGAFADASGSFIGTGTLTRIVSPPSVMQTQTFMGSVNLPEPSTWAMMLAGLLGLAWYSLRRKAALHTTPV